MDKYLGENIPKLGFGLMRLPMKDGAIDLEQTKEMVDLFMSEGFCYFDTAYGYNDGESEKAAKAALVDRYPREKFLLATKLPAWAGAKTEEEAKQMFYTSLERTGAGYFDFYLLHNLGEQRTHFFDDYEIWDFLKERKKEGLIRHLGFSMHDKAEVLDQILTEHPEMEFVQLQINYADWENPAVQSKACYEVARKHGKPVVIMEPIKGGMLANPPETVAEVFKNAEPDSSAASWAVRFAASLEGVITVLSGMSSVDQMKDNLSYMKGFQGLNAEQQAVIAKAQEELKKIPLIPCTTCNYCAKVCPKNIGISGSFTAMNLLTLYRDKAFAKHQEEWLVGGHGKARADQCVKCGKCEEACPQHIKIRENLEKVCEALL